MKKLFTILFVVSCFITNAQHVKRYLTNQGSWGAAYTMNVNFTCNPGDTLVFKNSNAVVTMALINFYGTVTDTIVITGENGEQSILPPFALHSCAFIKVSGKNYAGDRFGLVSDSSFSGFDIDGRSHDILMENIKITNAWYIGRIKQDGSCEDSLNYPHHIYNIECRNIWAKNINADGWYIGNTAPVDGRPVFPCGTSPVPMRLANISVHDCYLEHIGRTGIQFSGCDSGNQYIYNDTIIGTGYELNQTQGSGIIIGGMTKNCYMHNNYTRNTFQFGANDMGYVFNRIENNNIAQPGQIIMTERNKDTLSNTDTQYIAARCYFDNVVGGGVQSVILTGQRISGTVNGLAYILGRGFVAGQAWDMFTENTFPDSGWHVISDTFNFSNVSSQTHTFTVTGTTQFYKIVIKQTGTQSNYWSGKIYNNWYPYSIGAQSLVTGPNSDSTSVWIKNNTVDNDGALRSGSDIYILNGPGTSWYVNGNNIICGNLKQNGGDPTIYVEAAINYTTICTSSGVNYRWHKPANSRVIIRHF